jgi:hypothetical protein
MMKNLLLVVMFCCTAHAATRSWRAGELPDGKGLTAIQASGANFKIETIGTEKFAVVAPIKDYYRRATLLLRVDQPMSGKAWLAVKYLDRGYGLMAASTGGQQLSQHGTARLNTGKMRTVVFAVENPGSEIRLQGVQYVCSVELTDTQPALEEIPKVEPAFRLRQPLELVISAGADAATVSGLPEALATMREQLPLVRALGFNGVESYVKWDFVERSPGVFDWSFYDALVDEIGEYDLRWFPLLVVGSPYTLTEWFHDSGEFRPFECLEHHIKIDIPTIFYDGQEKYVHRFLHEFGEHYGSRKVLLGVRLGPSANYGEAQYPATGDMRYKGRPLHTHIGYWAADPDASISFRNWVRSHYPTPMALNQEWGTQYDSFDQVSTFLPVTAQTPRMRVDFSTWYMDAMSAWCGKWAAWAREAMPNTSIYQSSGGWGAVEIGTDYSAHARDMARLKGGIRLTNENDSYLNNFVTTRMAASAARFYGAKLGFEPAGFSSARGVMGRLFNTLTNGADHLFYYGGNIMDFDQSPALWLAHAPRFDQRAKPLIETAVFYPDTANKLNDEVLRYRLASTFFERAALLRAVTDYDYASEQMIMDGALDRYKVLVFLWGRVTEKPVLERIARWVDAGGIVIYPVRQEAEAGTLITVEGDSSISSAWQAGKTGKGRVIFFDGYSEPSKYYISFVQSTLRTLPQLRPEVRNALRIQSSGEVYWSVLKTGKLVLLNYDDRESAVKLADGRTLLLKPYAMTID